jgi:hypothetical protein
MPSKEHLETRPRPGVWYALPEIIKGINQHESHEWIDHQLEAIEALMRQDEGERGGGLTGATPELTHVRKSLVAVGRQILAYQQIWRSMRRMGEHRRKPKRGR